MTASIRMVVGGAVVSADELDPASTLLEFIRNRLNRRGTKEGCAEGDCGACTVLVGEYDNDRISWRSINACIAPIALFDGCAIVTVEDIARDPRFAPLRDNLIDGGASQCGFCTPGFVISIASRAVGALGTDVEVTDLLAGNLCRCTGYGGIAQAAGSVEFFEYEDQSLKEKLDSLIRFEGTAFGAGALGEQPQTRWYAPSDADEVARLTSEHPEAIIVAGATDLGLKLATSAPRDPIYIALDGARDLAEIEELNDGVRIGAAVRIVDATPVLRRLFPGITEILMRFGSVQVRNAATVVGNIANGSPVGDLPPVLIALGAELTLRFGNRRRKIMLDEYYTAYRESQRRPGEFIESIFIPSASSDTRFLATKLSKRRDCDISSVCGAFCVKVEAGVITAAKIAFGGMAAIPARAKACEQAMTGKEWSEKTMDIAAGALASDFEPWTDLRGSANYRRIAAANLVRNFYFAANSAPPPLHSLQPVSG